MNPQCSPISIRTNLKEASSCLWRFKWKHILISYIAFLPFTLVGISGLLDAFFLPRSSLEQVPDGYNFSFFMFILTTYFWAVPCFVLWHRLYLLGPEHLLRRKIWPILTRSFVLFLKVLMMIGICILLAVIFAILMSLFISLLNLNTTFSDLLELSDYEYLRYVSTISLTLFFAYLIFLRFSLAISARTIGKRIGMATSWRLTKTNTLRMFFCYLTILLPIMALSMGVLFVYQALFELDLFFSGEILNRETYVHIFLLAPVLCLPIAASCSQCASFYRHCGGEECSQY